MASGDPQRTATGDAGRALGDAGADLYVEGWIGLAGELDACILLTSIPVALRQLRGYFARPAAGDTGSMRNL